jgi:hypothetical protein
MPLVPEVSLFLPGGGGGLPYGGWNNNIGGSKGAAPGLHQMVPNWRPSAGVMAHPRPMTPTFNNSSSLKVRSQPPSPHQPLLQGIRQPTSDFSRLFDTSLSIYDSSSGGGGAVDNHNFGQRPEPGQGRPPAAICFTDRVEGLATRIPPGPADVPVSVPPQQINWQAPVKNPQTMIGAKDLEPVVVDNQSSPQSAMRRPSMETPPPRIFSNHNNNNGLPEENSSPSVVPPEILRVLNWQNEQLRLLQEQVRLLLDSSSPHLNRSETRQQPSARASNNNTQPAEDGVRVSEASRMVSTVGTNTSSLWPEIQQGLARLQQIVEQEEEEEEDSISYGEINKENIPVSKTYRVRKCCGSEFEKSPQNTFESNERLFLEKCRAKILVFRI